jgi:hypothetical protein
MRRQQKRWTKGWSPRPRVFADPLRPDAPEGPVWAVAFDPTGEYLAAASADHVLRIWRIGESQPVRVLTARGRLQGSWRLAWGERALYAWTPSVLHRLTWPDGPWEHFPFHAELVAASGEEWVVIPKRGPGRRRGPVERWRMRPGRAGRDGPFPRWHHCHPLTWLPGLGRLLVSIDLGQWPAHHRVLATQSPDGLQPLRAEWGWPPPSAWVKHAAEDGGLLVVGIDTGEVCLLEDDGAWRPMGSTGHRCWTSVAVSAATHRVALGGAFGVRVVSADDGRTEWAVAAPAAVADVCFGADDRSVVCGFEGGRVARWTPGAPPEWVAPPLALTTDDHVVVDRDHAAATHDGVVYVWSLATGRTVREVPQLTPDPSRWGPSPALRWPWLAQRDATRLELVRLDTGEVVTQPCETTGGRPVFAPDGRVAVALSGPTGDGRALGWLDPADGTWTEHVASIALNARDQGLPTRLLAWSRAGLLVATGHGRVHLDRLDGSPAEVVLNQSHRTASAGDVDAAGAVVLGQEWTTIVLYGAPPAHVGAGTPRALTPLYRHRTEAVTVDLPSVALSADGTRVASGGADGWVVVAEVTGRRLGRLRTP